MIKDYNNICKIYETKTFNLYKIIYNMIIIMYYIYLSGSEVVNIMQLLLCIISQWQCSGYHNVGITMYYMTVVVKCLVYCSYYYVLCIIMVVKQLI